MRSLGLVCLLCTAACAANPTNDTDSGTATDGVDTSSTGGSLPTESSAPTSSATEAHTSNLTDTAPTDTGPITDSSSEDATTTDPTTATDTTDTSTDTDGDPACPQPTPNPGLDFSNAGQYIVGDMPLDAAIGDLDGDGDGDLVIANFGSSTIEVLLGDGTGRGAVQVVYPVSPAPRAVAVGDMDGDQDLDIVASGMHLLLNDGAGGFAPAVSIADQAGVAVEELALADIDLDADLDVVTADGDAHTVTIVRNNGGGAFVASIGPPVLEALDVEVADMTGDDLPDLVVCGYDGGGGPGEVQVLQGNGMGAFAAPKSFYNVVKVHSCALADVDSDTDLDVVAAGPNAGKALVILPNLGGGDLGVEQLITPVTDPFDIATVDIDGDGVLDLVRRGYRDVSFYQGTGDGFVLQVYRTTAFAEYPMAIGLVDDDEWQDVLTIHPDLGILELLLGSDAWGLQPPDTAVGIINDAATIAAGDLDDDGDRDLVIGAGSSRVFFTRTEPGGVFIPGDPVLTSNDGNDLAIADFDGDGDRDVLAGSSDDNGGPRLYRNDGGFVFDGVASGIPTGMVDYLVGDLDGDGDRDVVARWYWVYAEFNNGDGTFLGTGNPVDMDAESVDAGLGDLDGDGDLEIVNLLTSAKVRVLDNDGFGAFTFVADGATGPGPVALVVADLDGDTDRDIAVATAAGIEVLFNENDFVLSAGPQLALALEISALAGADLDGDGDTDLVVLDRAGHRLQVLVNAGDASFGEGPRFAVAENPNAITIADIDGDCAPDLAVTRFESEAASVLFARP